MVTTATEGFTLFHIRHSMLEGAIPSRRCGTGYILILDWFIGREGEDEDEDEAEGPLPTDTRTKGIISSSPTRPTSGI